MLYALFVARPAAPRRQPRVALHLYRSLQAQLAPPLGLFHRGHHPPLLHHFQRVDRHHRLGLGDHLHRAPIARQPHRVPHLVTIDAEADQRAAAVEGAARGHVLAPVVVGERLVLGDLHVGAIDPHRHVAAHFVGAADQRQLVAAIEVAVVLAVHVHPVPEHLHCVGATRGNQGGWLAVGAGQMRDHHAAALRSAAVGPLGHGHFERPAQFGFAQAVRTPRHHRLLQPHEDQMPQKVLPIFLGYIDDMIAVGRGHFAAGKFFGIGKQPAPLRLQQVDHVQILTLRLGKATLRRQEMHVRVAAVPAFLVHLPPALQPQLQGALAWLDLQFGAQRLVFVATRHIHDHFSARQPALAGAVDVRIGDLPQAHIAAHIEVPSPHVGVDVGVVAVRSVGDALRRAEVDAAGHGLPSGVVDDLGMHPVAPALHHLQPHSRRSLHAALLPHLLPAGLPQNFSVSLDLHSGRRIGGNFHV